MAHIEDLKTMGQIAREHRIDRDRLRHIIERYRVDEAGRIGKMRVFDPEAVAKIVRIDREISERVALR